MRNLTQPQPTVQHLVSAASNLLLGSTCPGCGAPGWAVCAECRARLPNATRAVQRPESLDLPAARACGSYAAPLSRLVIAHKDGGAWQLAGLLGSLLAEAVAGLDPAPDVVLVPVPSDRSAVRRRGYDHALVLARVAGRELGLPVRQLVGRQRVASDQVGRNRADRLNAQVDTMICRPNSGTAPGGRSAIVVDDIITTGSTMAEAVRALRAAGYQVRGVAAICETPRWGESGE